VSARNAIVVFVPAERGFADFSLPRDTGVLGATEISVVAAGDIPALGEGLPGVRRRTLEELQELELPQCRFLLLDADGAPPLELTGCEGMAELERRVLLERVLAAMRRGVRIRDPRTAYIRGELECGAGVEIEVDVVLEGRVVLGEGVTIGAHSIVRNSTIGQRTRVHPYSLIEDSTMGAGGFVGPYGRLRPGCSIGDAVQIGNFVEIKSSIIGAGTRINHHSFIGDAVLGERVTIGAGTITCNHDGSGVQHTTIGAGAYVGSGCCLIAPLNIGEGATIGAGSTVSREVPAGRLTVARAQARTVENWRGPRSSRKEP